LWILCVIDALGRLYKRGAHLNQNGDEMHSVSSVSSLPPTAVLRASQSAPAPAGDVDGGRDGSTAPDAAKPAGIGGLLDTKACPRPGGRRVCGRPPLSPPPEPVIAGAPNDVVTARTTPKR